MKQNKTDFKVINYKVFLDVSLLSLNRSQLSPRPGPFIIIQGRNPLFFPLGLCHQSDPKYSHNNSSMSNLNLPSLKQQNPERARNSYSYKYLIIYFSAAEALL